MSQRIVVTPSVTSSRCDFCSEVPVHAWYDAPDMDCSHFTQHTIPVISRSFWAACKVCSELIEKDKWDDLVSRALDLIVQSHPEMIPIKERLRVLVKKTYYELRDKIRKAN